MARLKIFVLQLPKRVLLLQKELAGLEQGILLNGGRTIQGRHWKLVLAWTHQVKVVLLALKLCHWTSLWLPKRILIGRGLSYPLEICRCPVKFSGHLSNLRLQDLHNVVMDFILVGLNHLFNFSHCWQDEAIALLFASKSVDSLHSSFHRDRIGGGNNRLELLGGCVQTLQRKLLQVTSGKEHRHHFVCDIHVGKVRCSLRRRFLLFWF